MSAAFALALLNIAPVLLEAGAAGLETFNRHKDALQTMVNEGRDPTPAEWDALNAEISALQDRLHSDDR